MIKKNNNYTDKGARSRKDNVNICIDTTLGLQCGVSVITKVG